MLSILSQVIIHGQAIPQTINYQGVLKDGSGVIVANGDYNITFKLYDAAANGSMLWTETKMINIVDGIINTQLGSAIPITLPFNKEYWLGITIASESELIPRIKLSSVPYSFMSMNVPDGTITGEKIGNGELVRSLNGLKDKVILVGGTNVSITPSGNDINISSSASGDNWGTQSVLTDPTLSGDGTATSQLKISQQSANVGQVLKWSGSTWTPNNDLTGSSLWTQSGSNIYFNTGKVGIGKDPGTDSRQFQVIGGSNIAISAENSTASFSTMYAKNSTANGLAALFENTSGPVVRFGRNIIIADGTQGAGKVLTSDANGMTSWQTPLSSPWLQNATNIYYDAGWVGIGKSVVNFPLDISNANNTCYIHLLDNQGTGGMRMGAYTGDLALINDNLDRNIRLSVNTSTGYKQMMTLVASTQRVGINTTSPPYSLSVLGGDISLLTENSGISASD
jgi:hypothetical protein